MIQPSELSVGTAPMPGLLPEKHKFQSALQRVGYNHEKTVIVVDSEGGPAAGRLAWLLDTIGHDEWRYLNGGMQAWAASQPYQSSIPVNHEHDTPSIDFDSSTYVEGNQLLDLINDPSLCVWDCRTQGEYVGANPRAQRNGHIPGAIHLDWSELVEPHQGFTIRADAQDQLEQRGIRPSNDLVVHCHTHHRSGFAYMLARILDYPSVRAYPGSWSEWGNRPDTPIVQGPNPS